MEREHETTQAITDVIAERHRQIEKEGFDAEHDEQNNNTQLSLAAACYALNASSKLSLRILKSYSTSDFPAGLWPWDKTWWKPTTPRKDLIKAAALLIAQIDLLDRKNKDKRPMSEEEFSLVRPRKVLDKVIMPPELTEHREKFHQFHTTTHLACPLCTSAEDARNDCEHCAGTGSIQSKTPISWPTIKEIYAMAVKHLSTPALQITTSIPEGTQILGDRLVTSINLSALKDLIESPLANIGQSTYKACVTDIDEMSKSMASTISFEDEAGLNRFHYMLIDAAIESVEQGEPGIDITEDEESES